MVRFQAPDLGQVLEVEMQRDRQPLSLDRDDTQLLKMPAHLALGLSPGQAVARPRASLAAQPHLVAAPVDAKRRVVGDDPVLALALDEAARAVRPPHCHSQTLSRLSPLRHSTPIRGRRAPIGSAV